MLVSLSGLIPKLQRHDFRARVSLPERRARGQEFFAGVDRFCAIRDAGACAVAVTETVDRRSGKDGTYPIWVKLSPGQQFAAEEKGLSG